MNMSVHCVICVISSIERLLSQVIQLVKLPAKKAARNTAEKEVRRVEGSSHKGYKRVDALGAENRKQYVRVGVSRANLAPVPRTWEYSPCHTSRARQKSHNPVE